MSAAQRRVLHLSDLHLNARGELRYGVDADLALGAVLESCASLGELAAVIVTGDIADDGSEAAYNRARDLLLDFARTRCARLVFCVGNHDDRDAFTRSLGSGHIDADGNDCAVTVGPAGRICAVSEADGVRIVTLDSLVPGKWYGHLGTEQLRWVAALPASEQPSILAFHHPPVDLGVQIQRRVGLDDRDRLAAVVGSSLVTAILCGHFHQQIAGSVNGVPAWVTPGVFTRIDHLTGPPGSTSGSWGSAALCGLIGRCGPSQDSPAVETMNENTFLIASSSRPRVQPGFGWRHKHAAASRNSRPTLGTLAQPRGAVQEEARQKTGRLLFPLRGALQESSAAACWAQGAAAHADEGVRWRTERDDD